MRPLARFGLPLAILWALLASIPAPAQESFRLSGLGGGTLTEADLARGATIVVVWASWSPRSRDIVERVNPIAERWGSQARVVTVNFQEDGAAIEPFLAGKGLRPPVYLDREGVFAKRHKVFNLPGLVVFVDGHAAYSGKLPDDPDRLLSEVLR
jgi:thiol-disulfide isomerase/thioredoxin